MLYTQKLFFVFMIVVSKVCGFASVPKNAALRVGCHQNKQHKQRHFHRHAEIITAQKSKDGDSTDDLSSPTTVSSTGPWLFGLCMPLWLVYVSNQWSRTSLYYLVDFNPNANPVTAMNVDIGFSESQYGFLASVAFTSLFAVASLGAGIVSDRYNRKVLTVGAAITWSLATLGTAMSSSYDQVLACRIAMGLACAFSTPTAYTLIQERVPADRASLASSLYGTGVAIGGGLASLSILLDRAIGWRESLILISIFGIVSAGLSLTLLANDPKEEIIETTRDNGNDLTIYSEDSGPLSSVWQDVQECASTSRAQWLFLGSFLRFCSGLCIGVWSAPLFRSAFPDQQDNYALVQAGITAVASSISGLLGGSIADKLIASNAENEDVDAVGLGMWVPVVGSLLAAPAWYLAIQLDQSFETAMLWLTLEYLVAECWFGPTISTLQATVGPKIGGTAQGLFTLTGAIANFAPAALGFLYGQSTATEGESSAKLTELLVFGVCFGYIASAFCFAMAAQSPPSIDEEKVKTI